MKQKRRAHFQKLGAINEHFYNGNNKKVRTKSNQMKSILTFQIVDKSLEFTLNSVPYKEFNEQYLPYIDINKVGACFHRELKEPVNNLEIF